MKSRIPQTVLLLGVVSFFSDVSSEMIYPLMPVFLTEVLKADKLALGVIEGVAEATSAFFKIFSGFWTDRLKKRKPFILVGYTIPSITRPLVGLAAAWPMVLGLRFLDRIGKGLRTSPRDALISDVTTPEDRGRSYGFHRAMDHSGAVTGPLIASLFLYQLGWPLRQVFLFSAVPGLISIAIILFFLRDSAPKTPLPSTESKVETSKGHFKDGWSRLNRETKIFLVILVVFSIGQSTDAFLLMRMNEVGVGAGGIALIWSAHHVVKMVSNFFFGGVGDRLGHKKLLLIGWVFYATLYAIFGQLQSANALVGCFLLYGVYYGLSEPSERAIISLMAPADAHGTAFGYFNFVIGISVLPASLIFGWLWKSHGAGAAFNFGAITSLIAAVAFARFLPIKN